MNRNAIKTFATWARTHLLEQVTAKATQYGLLESEGIIEPTYIPDGMILLGKTYDAEVTRRYKQLRQDLGRSLEQYKRSQGEVVATLLDEMAYTWFNRLAALRYMEVNGYTERTLSSSEGSGKNDADFLDPDLLKNASSLVAAGDLNSERRVTLQDLEAWRNEGDEATYAHLLDAHCQTLAEPLPHLFKAHPYASLFLPNTLLTPGSVIRRLVADIPEESWRDEDETNSEEGGVEIIGWLYQFYIAERKDEVIGSKGAVSAQDIPAATQLFTPRWIVRYMLENSLGRLWLERHPGSKLREYMPYYLEADSSEAELENKQAHLLNVTLSNVEGSRPALSDSGEGKGRDSFSPLRSAQNDRERDVTPSEAEGSRLSFSDSEEGKGRDSFSPLRSAQNDRLEPQDLTLLDPACGSGHILVYAFDLLTHIYREEGYPERDIPALILEHNLFGLDIDERAVQLASFALLMKARKVSRRVLRKPPTLQVHQVRPFFGADLPDAPELNRDAWQPLLTAFNDADTLGSLITPPEYDAHALRDQLNRLEASNPFHADAAPALRQLLAQADLLGRQYAAVVANPPYMGSKSFNPVLKAFVNDIYKEGKQDLYGVYMLRNLELCRENGAVAMITIPNWMFLSSFEDLRKILLRTSFISSMAHNGRGVWGSDFGSVSFVLRKTHNENALGIYKKLFDKHVNVATNEEIERRFLAREPYLAKSSNFRKIPGSPIAYWMSEKVLEAFEKSQPLATLAEVRQGIATAMNDRFLRFWFEVKFDKFVTDCKSRAEAIRSKRKWFPYNKGGEYRKWYGNRSLVINWENDGQELFNFSGSVIRNPHTFFQESVTWSSLTSSVPSFRYSPNGALYDSKGSSIFAPEHLTSDVICVLNSNVSTQIFQILSPTIDVGNGQVGRFPVLSHDNQLSAERASFTTLVNCAKQDWDNFETSWDFQTHPLLRTSSSKLSTAFTSWQQQANTSFNELKRLEEENNRYWIEAYGLEGELSPEVPEEQITIRRADEERDVKSLISYAVGCMMGRYSLHQPGLRFAGGAFDLSRFEGEFLPDDDGIVPITDRAYFEDDIVTRFEDFLRVAYGAEHLRENLAFVADALTRKSGESARERIRRYFMSEFMSDHIRAYSKRPIYWLFTSGKGRAFGALVYLHRYKEETLARLRTAYLLELQAKLDAERERLEGEVEAASSAGAKKVAQRRLKEVGAQILELREYHDKVQHAADKRIGVDLDDGVAYNYTLFKGLLYEGSDLKMKDMEKKSQWKRDLLKQEVKEKVAV